MVNLKSLVDCIEGRLLVIGFRPEGDDIQTVQRELVVAIQSSQDPWYGMCYNDCRSSPARLPAEPVP